MIISRTPFRISFFGGGTDYPGWYREHGGQVLSTSIDKYCYISLRYLPPFFQHRIRVVYSKIENVRKVEDIMHPAVRECLKYLDFDQNCEIHHDGDLPARSGMGSSSSFTVGLLHALYGLMGRMPSKARLAKDAIAVEQDWIKETVGSQDQCAAAHGGFNHIIFHKNGDIEVRPMTIAVDRIAELNDNLMLFYTGIMRTASDVAQSYVEDLAAKHELLRKMEALAPEAVELLQSPACICKFGEMLDHAWRLKRGLSGKVSNPVVDELYDRARKNGAVGGKITGAGGGGFLLLFVPPTSQNRVRAALKDLLHVPFRFEHYGSQVLFREPGYRNYCDSPGANACAPKPFIEHSSIDQ